MMLPRNVYTKQPHQSGEENEGKLSAMTESEQQKIAEFLYELETQIDGQIKKEEATRLELEQLRKGLIQVFLTGKTRIRT